MHVGEPASEPLSPVDLETSRRVSSAADTRAACALSRIAGAGALRLAVVTMVRLLGEGLMRVLQSGSRVEVMGVAQNLDQLRELLRTHEVQVALIDVSGSLDLNETRLLAAERPHVKLIALGVVEHRSEVIRCARAGFCGYIPRDVPLPELEPLLIDAAQGRARCSGEVAEGLMHALFQPGSAAVEAASSPAFTRREEEILRLLGRGLSNKEIARDLALSLGTVKKHIHSVLTKLQVPSRCDATRLVRERPWVASLCA